MKRWWMTFVFIVCTIFLLNSCTNNNENKKEIVPEYVFTYAENHPDNYPTSKAAAKFAELVKERTDGRIIIQVKYNAEFGTQQQVVNQMKFGGVDFARVSLSSLSDELPELNVLQLPFLYDDSDHMWRVLNGEIGKELWNSFYKLDLVPLSWFDAGARSFYANKPITRLEDFNGMSIRVQESQLMRDMISYLGGIPVDKAYSEVYSAFETGAITMAENNWSSYHAAAHYKVAKYYILDEHTRVPEIQLMSGETWKLLSDDDIRVIKNCALQSAEYEKVLWKQQEEDSRNSVLKFGTEEIILKDTELERLREKVAPLYEEYCSDYMNLVEKIKQESRK